MAGERTESEGFYEMLWDCDHCETKGLLGKSQRHCAGCGAPQNPDKRYFPKAGEEKRVDGHRFEGSDRHCPSCNAPMGAAATNCTQCGSPLDGSKEVRGIAAAPKAPAPPRRKIWPYVVLAFALIVFLTWYYFIRTKEATLAVTAHRWERTIAIEKFGDYQHEAWRNEVPADVTGQLLCSRRERSKKQVADGEECHTDKVDKKDGTFEMVKKCKTKYRSEPVEDDWCVFTARRWEKVDTFKASGAGLDAKWPDKAPPADTAAALGATRSGAKGETLFLDFGKKGSCEVKESKWRKYKDGENVKMEVRARSGLLVCESL